MEYRGADGWLYDGSADGVRRSEHHREQVRPPARAEAPGSPSATPARGQVPLRRSCPNCGFGVTWRRMEGRCEGCGWTEGPVERFGVSVEKSEVSDAVTAGILCLVAAVVICPLIGMGVGYTLAGFGGLAVGAGLGLAVPIGFVVVAGILSK